MKALTSHKQLSKIALSGFKSIAECELRMGRLNVLIGSNGAGKSNFVGFFRLIQQMLQGNLQTYVSKQGGPDALLHFGRKTTASLKTELYFGNNGYWFNLEPTQDNRMMFATESFWWNMSGPRLIGSGHFETRAFDGTGTGIDSYVLPSMSTWRVFHFHDTSESAYVKQAHGISDNDYLRSDARNLAAFLYFLRTKHLSSYERIVKSIRLVAPFFGDFKLRPSPGNEDMIELEWVEKGHDVPFKAHHLSDGTLRFICLAVVFMQPDELQPQTILVDEPELGLHPYAISVLGSLVRSVATEKQVILSTQSVELLNEFESEDVVVVDRNQGQSSLTRLNSSELQQWLDEYTLGEMWKKNLLGGRPKT